MRRALAAVAGLAVLAAVSAALLLPAGARGGDAPAADNASVLTGRTLYVESCSSCHGMRARGIRGVAPSLVGIGALAADFELSTGRMPMADPSIQPVRSPSPFDARQRAELVAYIASLGGPPVPAVDTRAASLAEGRQLFADNCAGCHTTIGAGGVVTGATVPSLQRATARQVVEAIRLGPYQMPRFGTGALSDEQAAAIARYVLWTRSPHDAGGWATGHVG